MKRVGDVLKRLGADVASLERARHSRAQRDGEKLEAMLREVVSPAEAAHLANLYIAKTPNPQKTEPFVMITASQNAEVVRWLGEHSKRPHAATMLWATLFTALHPETGEILLSRTDIAGRVGILPRDASSIMTELASIRAIRREKRGREVRYFMSPHIATHLPTGAKLDEARKASPTLRLVSIASERDEMEAAGQMRLID